MFFIEQVCLGLTAQIAAMALLGWLFPSLRHSLPSVLFQISGPQALSALCCCLGFFLAEPDRSATAQLPTWIFAGLTLLISVSSIPFGNDRFLTAISHIVHIFPIDGSIRSSNDGAPAQSAIAFALLAIVTVLVRAGTPFLHRIADILKITICLLVVHLFWEFTLTAVGAVTPSQAKPVSLPTLACLLLLSFVAVLSGSELGVFRIYFGSSIGSRVARWLLPVLIFLQCFREAVRARILLSPTGPLFFVAPVLTSIATVVLFALVWVIARRINRMENEIRDLTLRDGLTGLYNVKGFHLLGESALLSARRARMPFAVLFIDLDKLKEINDTHGHHIGSAALTETAKLLAASFREHDIIGRIGGDEFAVAGQFSMDAIASIVQRLHAITAARNPELQRRFPLSFSIGCAVASGETSESLRDLITKADKAMYQEKKSARRA
jgi:diguanylate cyclase (GGDEF)-like protein